MTTLTQTPPDKLLVDRSPTWSIRVEGISPLSTPGSRTLSVSRAGTGVIYTAVNGVTTFLHPTFSVAVAYSGTVLDVQLQLTSPAVQGEAFIFTTTYADSATSTLTVARSHLAGDALLLARSPTPGATQVSPTSPVLLTVSTSSPLSIESAQVVIDGSVAYDSFTGFVRPDFSGSSFLISSLLSLNVSSRRHFPEDEPVDVSVEVGFKSSSALIATRTYAWSFNPVFDQTTTRDAALQLTNLDYSNARALTETFRQAALNALRPPQSTASFAVLLFYAVQVSSLASIAGYLPDAARLRAEVSRLQAKDLVSPETAYESVAPVAPLFELFLRELVAIGQALPEEAELLLRAWESQGASNRLGAVAAALLYAIPLAE